LRGDRATIGERLLRTILDVWGKDREADLLVGIARSAVTNERAAAQLRPIAGPELLGGLTRALGLDEPELRAAIVASQVMGLIMARYLIRVPLLADAEPARLIRLYAPAIQRTLTDPLDATG
ncbi:MAG: TetR/AcrR family transcriptional regulator, partial [Candidatus Dormiibacterota bacterium]